jgi:DNA-binding transcriptional regulator PaaX
MATIQQFKLRGSGGSSGFIDKVYTIIRNKSGKVTSKDLDEMIGNKQYVRLAITRLTVQGRIKRVRGFGKMGIEYFYKDIDRQLQRTSRIKQSTSTSSYH